LTEIMFMPSTAASAISAISHWGTGMNAFQKWK
jgi:hypothetical protein